VEKIEEKGERKGSKSWKIHLKQIYMPYIATKPICLTDTKDRNDKCWCGSIFQTAFMFVLHIYIIKTMSFKLSMANNQSSCATRKNTSKCLSIDLDFN
jgi:hypothetical protein